MQTTLIVLAIVMLIFTSLLLFSRYKIKKIPLVKDHNKILTLTNNNFQVSTRNRVVLVDFWAAWCGPCRMMAPVLNDVSKELSGNKHVAKVDIEKYQNLAKKFKVKSIPTMVLLKDGMEVNRFIGVKSKNFLLKEINNLNN